MIASSRGAGWAAGLLALFAHAALLLLWATPPEVMMEGGSGAPEARIGNSFADMAAGTLTAETPQDTAQLVEADPADVPEADRPDTAQEAERVSAEPEIAEPVAAQAAAAPLESAAIAPRSEAPTATAQDSAPTAPTPETAAVAATTAEAETVSPEDGAARAPTRSLRPMRRSAAFEARNAPPKPRTEERRLETPRTETPRQAAPTPRGNADTNAAAGITAGRSEATPSNRTGAQTQSSAAGNAAASNYPGTVMRKISGTRKPRLNRSGSARVSFSIGASGALAGASIAKSSGVAALDREALNLIRRASPFPPPPLGARTRFSIDIQFR